MTPPYRRPRLSQQHDLRERMKSVAAQDYTLKGSFFAEGVGEFLADVDFPVTFYEKPILVPGAIELVDDVAQFEHFPFAEIGIVGWKTRASSSDQASTYYVGARLGIRVSGRTDQRAWVPYKFEGPALTSLQAGSTS